MSTSDTHSKPLPLSEARELLLQLNKLIDSFAEHLRIGTLIYADLKVLPVAEIDKMGRDSVYDDIDTIKLEQRQSHDALEAYIEAIRVQYKSSSKSSIAARRSVGLIQITGNNSWVDQADKYLLEIHQLKATIKSDFAHAELTRYERSKRLQKIDSEVIALSAYRQFPFYTASEELATKITYSWLVSGYVTEELDKESVEKLIFRRNKAKIEAGLLIEMKALMSLDERKLPAMSNSDTLLYIRPAKIHPVVNLSLSFKGSLPTQKAALPYLILQSTPLEKFNALRDFDGVDSVKKRMGKKLNSHAPVISEYGLFRQLNKFVNQR